MSEAVEATATPAPPPADTSTQQGAAARLSELATNKEWASKLLAQDSEITREFQRLSQVAAGADARLESVMSGKTVDPGLVEFTTEDNPLTTRDLASAVEGLRGSGVRDDVIRQLFSDRKASPQERRMVEQLQAQRHGDAAWRTRLLSGDHEAMREQTLMSIVLSADVAAP